MKKRIVLTAAIAAVLQSTPIRADDALAHCDRIAEEEQMPVFGFMADAHDATQGGVHEYEHWFYDGDTAWEV